MSCVHHVLRFTTPQLAKKTKGALFCLAWCALCWVLKVFPDPFSLVLTIRMSEGDKIALAQLHKKEVARRAAHEEEDARLSEERKKREEERAKKREEREKRRAELDEKLPPVDPAEAKALDEKLKKADLKNRAREKSQKRRSQENVKYDEAAEAAAVAAEEKK
jgi:hypothetical protein